MRELDALVPQFCISIFLASVHVCQGCPFPERGGGVVEQSGESGDVVLPVRSELPIYAFAHSFVF